VKAFDEPASERINAARGDILLRLLGEARRRVDLAAAADVGCGFGHFSHLLLEAGLETTAVDGRRDNVEEAKRRYPELRIAVEDVESAGMGALGVFDLVLCFGLLYHLENPFAAVRNLAALTGRLLVVESVCAPGDEPATVMYEEDHDIDQALNYIAMIPTEAWLIKAMYASGLSHVYRTIAPPDHPDFRRRPVKRRRRTVLVATHMPLELPMLVPAEEPRTRRYLWDPFGSVLESEGLRRAVRQQLAGLARRRAE